MIDTCYGLVHEDVFMRLKNVQLLMLPSLVPDRP